MKSAKNEVARWVGKRAEAVTVRIRTRHGETEVMKRASAVLVAERKRWVYSYKLDCYVSIYLSQGSNYVVISNFFMYELCCFTVYIVNIFMCYSVPSLLQSKRDVVQFSLKDYRSTSFCTTSVDVKNLKIPLKKVNNFKNTRKIKVQLCVGTRKV